MMVLGVDPALGGGNAVIACRLTQDRLYVCDLRVDFGFARTEQQIEVIESFAALYEPSRVVLEHDAQQKGLGNDDRLRDLARRYGFSIVPHMTRGEKTDPVFGVASMDRSFRRREISIPWGDDVSRRRMGPLVDQLRAWRPDAKPNSVVQDAVMALWFVWRFWQKIRVSRHTDQPSSAPRPGWLASLPRDPASILVG